MSEPVNPGDTTKALFSRQEISNPSTAVMDETILAIDKFLSIKSATGAYHGQSEERGCYLKYIRAQYASHPQMERSLDGAQVRYSYILVSNTVYFSISKPMSTVFYSSKAFSDLADDKDNGDADYERELAKERQHSPQAPATGPARGVADIALAAAMIADGEEVSTIPLTVDAAHKQGVIASAELANCAMVSSVLLLLHFV